MERTFVEACMARIERSHSNEASWYFTGGRVGVMTKTLG
jgi:hypothetical protein